MDLAGCQLVYMIVGSMEALMSLQDVVERLLTSFATIDLFPIFLIFHWFPVVSLGLHFCRCQLRVESHHADFTEWIRVTSM